MMMMMISTVDLSQSLGGPSLSAKECPGPVFQFDSIRLS